MAVSYARNGAITITTAGTRVQGPDVPGAIFHLKANASTRLADVIGVTGAP